MLWMEKKIVATLISIVMTDQRINNKELLNKELLNP